MNSVSLGVPRHAARSFRMRACIRVAFDRLSGGDAACSSWKLSSEASRLLSITESPFTLSTTRSPDIAEDGVAACVIPASTLLFTREYETKHKQLILLATASDWTYAKHERANWCVKNATITYSRPVMRCCIYSETRNISNDFSPMPRVTIQYSALASLRLYLTV